MDVAQSRRDAGLSWSRATAVARRDSCSSVVSPSRSTPLECDGS